MRARRRPFLWGVSVRGVRASAPRGGGTRRRPSETEAGALAFVQFAAHLGPAAFLTLAPKVLQPILDCLQDESEVVTKQALEAGKVLIAEYGAAYPHLLLPRMQQALFFDTEAARALSMTLFFELCGKIAEAMKFGQDFLSMDALPQFYRHSLLSSIFIARTAEDHDVRRMSTLLWKEKVQSGPKAKAAILPFLLRVVKTLKVSGSKTKEIAIKGALEELTKDGDTNEQDLAKVEALTGVDSIIFALPLEAGASDPASAVIPEVETPPAPKPLRGQLLRQRVEEQVAAAELPNPLRKYIMVVLASCCAETCTRASAEAAAETELAPIAPAKEKDAKGGAIGAFGLKEVLDKIFDGIADAEERSANYNASDSLVYVENLRMMYGGGNLLLTNTTLELKKGHRYGVVGRNGAGKTTLMNTIASGGISQIPKSVKTLHVRPEILIAASDLTATQFCKKDRTPSGASPGNVFRPRRASSSGCPEQLRLWCPSLSLRVHRCGSRWFGARWRGFCPLATLLHPRGPLSSECWPSLLLGDLPALLPPPPGLPVPLWCPFFCTAHNSLLSPHA